MSPFRNLLTKLLKEAGIGHITVHALRHSFATRAIENGFEIRSLADILGHTDEGLAAMSDCQDLTTALARELTHGIEGEVEDLGAVFKRMALLKPEEDVIEGEAVVVDGTVVDTDNTIAVADDIATDDVVLVDTVTTAIAEPIPIAPTPSTVVTTQNAKEPTQPKQPAKPSGLLSMLDKPKPKRTQKKKPAALENQLTLFDLMESSA